MPAEKWGRPDAWEIRKDAERDVKDVSQGATRSFAGQESAVQIFSLIESTCAEAVFSAEK